MKNNTATKNATKNQASVRHSTKKRDTTKLELVKSDVKRGTNILSLKIPAALNERTKSGIKWIDQLVGGSVEEAGFTPSTALLFTGSSGAGKTTQSLALADAWTGSGGVCLYNSCEESGFQVAKTAKRLGLKHGFIFGEDQLIDDVLAHADILRRRSPKKPFLLIIDSVQTHNDGFYRDGAINTMTAVRVSKRCTSYAKRNLVTVVLIGQVTKEGKFSGKNAIKHDIDVHMHLDIENDEDSGHYGHRRFVIEKNRFGKAQIGAYAQMSKTGLTKTGDIDNA